MSSTSRTHSRRRGRLSQGGSHPDAVTDISQSAERVDSRADVAKLANAVVSLTQQVADLQAVVMALRPHPETPASVKTTPEDVDRTSELDDAAQLNRDRVVQDVSWFEEVADSTSMTKATPFVPNPWKQQIASASQMDIFDGDTRKWPMFIANFRALVHETIRSDAQRMALLGQLLSPRLRSGFSGLFADPAMYREVLRRLHKLYGDPKALAKMNLHDPMSLPPLRSEQSSDLEAIFCKVSGPVSTMKLCVLVHDLHLSSTGAYGK
ncbi:hypothetical protein M513_12960 [Trichuris suis]|uniref:Uncharacterized protein n=1 Tax=Trichuris suis TaxID=68888 RepID=A0A085LMF6_9BILA|nr:hypothetical protein M513_12960 [Trichuris suis]